MIPEAHQRALLESSKLKLAAKARLAEGGGDARYEASVLLHAAARAERRALLAMDAPSAAALLASAVERCGCLIDGLDPTVVIEAAWGEVLDASARVPEKTRVALRSRIDPKMAAFVAHYERALAKTPALKAWMDTGAPLATARSLGRELDRMLSAFPGDARLWGIRSLVHLGGGDIPAAWEAMRRARSLAPEDTALKQGELHLIPLHLPRARAEGLLDAVHADILHGEATTDICFGFVSAAMQLASRGGHRKKMLQQALDAATEGFRLPPLSPLDRKMFRAMQLILRELVAGRKPDLDILYRCGLGAWAAGSAERADPLAIVMQRMDPLRHMQAA